MPNQLLIFLSTTYSIPGAKTWSLLWFLPSFNTTYRCAPPHLPHSHNPSFLTCLLVTLCIFSLTISNPFLTTHGLVDFSKMKNIIICFLLHTLQWICLFSVLCLHSLVWLRWFFYKLAPLFLSNPVNHPFLPHFMHSSHDEFHFLSVLFLHTCCSLCI